MQYDFAGGDADFKDIYFGIKDIPVLGNLRVGQFKEPLSLEELNSSNSNSTIERANVNLLVPSRSAGIMAYDNFVDSRVSVAAGLFRGADDSYGNYKGEGYASTARLSGLPYLSEDASRLMHLAIGYSYRGDDTATYLLQQSCDLRISQLRMLIGFTAQSSLQLCLPGIRLFRPIRVGATIQPNMPAGRSCRTSIPGNKLLCHLPACVRGLQLFFKYLLQQFFTQHLVGQHPLEPCVLPLEFLELLGLIDLKHPQLSLPPVVGLLADLPLSAYILYRPITALRLPEDAYFAFYCVSFYFHFLDPF